MDPDLEFLLFYFFSTSTLNDFREIVTYLFIYQIFLILGISKILLKDLSNQIYNKNATDNTFNNIIHNTNSKTYAKYLNVIIYNS